MENSNPGVQNNYPTTETVGFPPQSSPRSSQKGYLKWVIIAIIGILVIGGAAFFVLSGGENNSTNPTPTSASISFVTTPEPDSQTPAPTATPAAADKSAISIQVNNGTGISGEAAYLQQLLKSAGYSQVKTGNSSGPNVTVTTMTYSSTVSNAIVSEITKLLENSYQQVETKVSSSAGSGDITVVVGLRKGETPKPVATSTPKASASASPTASPTATP